MTCTVVMPSTVRRDPPVCNFRTLPGTAGLVCYAAGFRTSTGKFEDTLGGSPSMHRFVSARGPRSVVVFFVTGLLSLPASGRADTAATQPSPTTVPSTKNALAVPVESQPFDASNDMLGDPAGARTRLFNRGVQLDSNLILDYTKNTTGGLTTVASRIASASTSGLPSTPKNSSICTAAPSRPFINCSMGRTPAGPWWATTRTWST